MSKAKLERLRGKIHGKQVLYVSSKVPEELQFEAILLWEKGGKKVAVKPINLAPEELYIAHALVYGDKFEIETFENPSFCFSTHDTRDWDGEFPALLVKGLTDLAAIPMYGVYDYDKVGQEDGFSIGSPSCPYA